MPPVDPDEYLPELMNEVGPVRRSDGGLNATDWDILVPFAQAKWLDGDDLYLLAAMCKEYSQEFAAAENPLRMAPMDRRTEPDG